MKKRFVLSCLLSLAVLTGCSLTTVFAEDKSIEAISITEDNQITHDGVTAKIITNDGEEEYLSMQDIKDTFSSNELKYEKKYAGATISVISKVEKIETNASFWIDSTHYDADIALYLDNGWLVIGNDYANENILPDLDLGDPILVHGSISGIEKAYNRVIIQDDGLDTPVFLTRFDEETNTLSASDIVDIAYQVLYDNDIEKASAIISVYMEAHTDLSEKDTQKLEEITNEILNVACYDGTDIIRLDYYLYHKRHEKPIFLSVSSNGNTTTYLHKFSSLNSSQVTYIFDKYKEYLRKYVSSAYKSNYGYNDFAEFTKYDAEGSPILIISETQQGNNIQVDVTFPSEEGLSAETNEDGFEANTQNSIYNDGDTIKKVQETLNNLGYDCGTPDGDKGPKTTSVIQQYQTDNGLEATGEIDDALLSSLGIQ